MGMWPKIIRVVKEWDQVLVDKNISKHAAITPVKNIIVTALCLIGTSLISCSIPKTSLSYTLCENYKNADLSKRPLLLELPGEKSIVIANPKDVISDYGGVNATPESRIEKFYLPIFVESFKSYLSGDSLIVAGGYHTEFSLPDSIKKQAELKTDKDSLALRFTIPTKPSMQAAGLDSAVLITIDRLIFKRNSFYYEYYWDDKTKQPANLEVQASVAIWDYKNDAPVFYGTITQKIEFQFGMNRKHWDESARALAKKIILSAKCL
jgi:hypothetical protein